jgi:hypothetical protein
LKALKLLKAVFLKNLLDLFLTCLHTAASFGTYEEMVLVLIFDERPEVLRETFSAEGVLATIKHLDLKLRR